MTAAAKRFRLPAILGLLVALLATAISVVGTSGSASAAPAGSTFQPGYIVSDANFFNYNSMTVAQIQAFLDLKGPATCNGCLKTYRASTYDRAADPKRCPVALTGRADISSAEMIYDVAQACHINPMTLLVTLQKETSLVTMSAPPDWRYQRAMGYGCPDSAPCSTSYYGLFIQLYSAASQLNYYGSAGSSFQWYPVGTWTAVRYSPNAACGVASVYIQNRATAALYYYTPYQPNAAALTNLYGTGNSCSAYGNRNFWRTWWDWFGDPTGAVATPTASVTASPTPSVSPSPASTSTTTTSTTTTSTTTTTATTTTTPPTTTTTAPNPSPTATTPTAPTVITYAVVPGDTLYKIATRYKTTVAAIAASNALKNVNLIYVGQKLKITVAGTGSTPTPTTTTPPPSGPTPTTTPTTTTPPPVTPVAAVTYTVVAGDTLYKIATKFHTTVKAIAAANGVTNVNVIRVGQKLKIPASGATTTTTTTTTTSAPPPAAPPAATTVTYTVVPGDTLGKIAAKYHTTVTAIAVANKIKNVSLIVVGQKLTITTG